MPWMITLEFFQEVFHSRDRSARWKSLAVIHWGMKDYESTESAAKDFVEEHCQQETKLAKDTTKDNLENHQLGTSLGPKQRLEIEFELLVSQLPDCRER